jgi:two-component system, NtrC family, sensor kinase
LNRPPPAEGLPEEAPGTRTREGEDPAAAASVRRELLVSTSLLFIAATAVAMAAAAAIIPLAPSPGWALLALSAILLADIAILYIYLRHLMDRTVVRPVERIVEHAERIAEGDLEHRIPSEPLEELDRIVDAVNSLAGRLIREQELLQKNVRSLNQTNRELTEATAELVRAARLASVGTLAAGVAHEIGNPLGALRGYLDVMRHRAEDPGQVKEIIDEARREVERIDGIIRHVLDFGRPAVRAQELPLMNPAEVVEEVVGLLAARGQLEESWVRRTEEPGLPWVRARSQHLERILVNLIQNARQATPPGAVAEIEVILRTEPAVRDTDVRRSGDPLGVDYSHRRRLGDLLRVKAPPPADAGDRDLLLEVKDRGTGIPEEILPRIFDPFFTSREPGAGMGMGLALTARIVGELGGTIEAENRTEGGACLRVRLPGVDVDGEGTQ